MAFSPENIRAHPRKEHNLLHASKPVAQTSMKFHETFNNHFTCFDSDIESESPPLRIFKI